MLLFNKMTMLNSSRLKETARKVQEECVFLFYLELCDQVNGNTFLSVTGHFMRHNILF